MYPADFDYYRAASLDEAIALLGEHEQAKLLAGGHSLIPMLKMRLAQPAALIDIGRLGELRGISVDDGLVRVGSLTSHRELADSEDLRSACRILSEAAARIGDPQVRNKGTIGGNIAHADPASDLPAVLVALGASIHLAGTDGKRQVPAPEFFVGLLATALDPGEIITHIEAPKLPEGSGCAYLKMEHPASGYAVCGAAALVSLSGEGTCSQARLCFNGVSATPYWNDELESTLQGTTLDDALIEEAVDRHIEVPEPISDAFASGTYRSHLAGVFGKRALKRARERARA